MEGQEKTLCLYECLKAVGLQRYYARFTSAGVCCTAHLSGLTMEDYPILGIRSMEDRTRLFHLVQMVKNLDLEYEDYGDDDYNIDGSDEGYLVADSSITHDGCGEPDKDVYDDEGWMGAAVSKLNDASFSKPSGVRRRLDFSCETIDRHQKQFSRPVGAVHVYASRNTNIEPGLGKVTTVPVHLEFDSGGAVVCSCKGNSNHRLDAHSHQYDHHTGANTKTDIMEGNSMYSSHTRLSAKCASSHKPKPRPETVTSVRFSNKQVRHKDRKGISRKEKLCTDAVTTPVYESKRTAGYNYGVPLSSSPAPNKKQPVGQRISVCVRKRPLTRRECRRGEADVVTTLSGECVVVHESKEAVDLTQYILQHRFYFDQVFGEESSNEEVYRRTACPLVQHMLNGGNATCFAYGQTGAGKTHTMLGSSPETPGLYALAVRDIFAHLSTTQTHSPLLVYVSFFEIYCGQLYDLLDHRKRLFAREDRQKVVHIAGLRDVRVDSISSLLEAISQGTAERTQGMSGVNPLSSRSHAMLQIQLRGPNQQMAGRMWFVDLAGSERASDTKEPDRQSRMEGAEINQSLLALKECIRSLDQEQSHTPFRQSKLTQVLKDSFVGDSMTCMIANISPGHSATEHTLNTLRYADRVKELRGQEGQGGRRSNIIPSPKHNLSSNNSSSECSSVGTRGKSPPKRPKLGRQRQAFGPTASTMRLATGGAVLCSTPKNSRWGKDTSARARNGIGLEEITPIRGLLGICDKRERRGRAGEREVRGRETYGGTDQNVRAGIVLGQATDEQLHLWEVDREKENQQSTLKGEGGWIGQRGHMENSRGTRGEVERLRERYLQKVDERDKERERHLKQYHQQLQQFMPSSASLSDHLFPPSTCPSFSSSNQVSPSSSFSPQQSSHISVSALMYHDLEKELDACRARVEVRTDDNSGQLSSLPSGELGLQTETSPRHNKNKDGVGHGDSGGTSEDLRVSLEDKEAGYGQDRGKSEKRRSLKATDQGQIRSRKEDWRPAGMEQGGERRWAWVATEIEQADMMTGARRGVSADGSDHLLAQSPHQRAPAERPLSPVCEHTNTPLTPNGLNDLSLELKHIRCTSNTLPLPLQNTQGVPSSSCGEKEPWFAANSYRREFSNAQLTTLPLTTPITYSGCKIPTEPLKILSENTAYTKVHSHPEVNAKMPVSAQGETSTDSLSYIIDPLSISLLQVDQQVTTASFLQGTQSNCSLCPLENERGGGKKRGVEKEHLTCVEMAEKVVEVEDVEFRLSLLELPQAKTHCPPASDTMTATDQPEQRKDVCFATYEHCRIGMMEPYIPEVMLVSLQDQENNQKPQTTSAIEVVDNKAPASQSTFASIETSEARQSISSSVQHCRNTGSPSSQNLMTHNAHNVHNNLAFSISKPQSESVLGQAVHSNYSSNSNISLQPNSAAESNSEESTTSLQIRPIIHLSTLEDLYHAQWRVVQAHWEQFEEMETLFHKEGALLYQQPDMAFGEYVHKLGEIMERKAQCVHSMIDQLQPYLKTSHSNQPHNEGEDNHDQIT